MYSKIENILKNILQEQYDISLEKIVLETPPKADMGDIALGCFQFAKILRKSPQVIAADLQKHLQEDRSSESLIESSEIVGPYLNIYLSSHLYSEKLEAFMQQENIYADISADSEKTIYIDYIGANV